MKYLVVLGDGMADEPGEALGGLTPLAYAHPPVMSGPSSSETVTKLHRKATSVSFIGAPMLSASNGERAHKSGAGKESHRYIRPGAGSGGGCGR